ncbi:S4 domain-containing protein YaaA [Agrilactobacillus yilanensis]|uniref:S4 domain-containing protein YaaA n=1 Tax=Agrilactobacillus yilanensis TaxID=2485997 RepID=A0ABW4J7X3_9LACO|nr:S4 domain-containing protein YaaA [Agrilactobacillus yilanensis]
MSLKTVVISQPYITLTQVLKEEGIIGTGGQAKWFLQENVVFVNHEAEQRRGRKLYPGDILEVLDQTFEIQKQV